MKTIIILGALVISTGVFAQGRIEKIEKEIAAPQTDINQQAQKAEQELNTRVNQAKEDIGNKGKAVVNDKVNSLKESAKDKMDMDMDLDMVKSKISEGKAASAKLKASEVKTKAEAEEMISTSKAETKETMGGIDTKLASARAKLAEKLALGELTKTQVDEKMAKLKSLEDRKNAIMSEME